MRWEAGKTQVRERYGDALRVAVTLSALSLLALAPNTQAQNPPTLPVTRVTAPSVTYTPGQEAKIKGYIISRNGDDMMLQDDQGHMNLVTLTADTKVESPSGLFNMDKKRRDVTSLLPGLAVEVKGNGGPRGNLVADKIVFHSSSLKTAEQVAAGTLALRRKVNANTDSIEALKDRMSDSLRMIEDRARDSLAAINMRFDNIDNYTAKDSAIVNFATGSATLDDHAKSRLDAIADNGMMQTGFLVEVRGYTDSRGGEQMNQDLSVRRAQAIVDYLAQHKNVPLRRILNPTGFGEMDPVASNQTSMGRAENRRGEVRILVNQGVNK